jgi:trehalose synthase
VEWTAAAHGVWESYVAMNARLLDERWDVIVVHDPQPLPIVHAGRERQPAARWVWHCHLDLSGTQPDVWAELAPSIEAYDAVIFDHPDFLPPALDHRDLRSIPPGIDPIGPRCAPVPADTVAVILRSYGLDPGRPLMTVTGPLDEESDALGAIAVHDVLADEFPDLQLLLVATHVYEDARTRAYHDRVVAAASDRPAVTVLSSLTQEIGNVELNTFQQESNVVLQLALRRGFGLWIAEAMWKGKPVVVGRAGGLPHQVEDGRTGYVIRSTTEAAERVRALLHDPARAAATGAAARERVRERFLITRVVADYVGLLSAALPTRTTR